VKLAATWIMTDLHKAQPVQSAQWALWFRLAVPAGTILLLIALGETAFRLIPNPYQQLVPLRVVGAWHVPGQTYVYEGALLGKRQPPDVAPNVVRWNRQGWHDTDHERVKPPGTVRVLVLGDSYVEGVQVRLEELYHRRLERLLEVDGGSVEVIAMGLRLGSGAGTDRSDDRWAWSAAGSGPRRIFAGERRAQQPPCA
jgi:hypothetical protein